MAGPKEVFVKNNDPELIAALEAADAELEAVRAKAQVLADSIGTNLAWQMYRDGFSGANTETEIAPRNDREGPYEVTDPAWKYIKTRNAVEPVRGAKGDAGREALAAVQPPAIQKSHLLAQSGLQDHILLIEFSRSYRTQHFIWEGNIYAMTVETDERPAKVEGNWTRVPQSEVRLAEAHMLAAHEAEQAEKSAAA